MPEVSADSIQDLVAATLKDLGRGQLVQIAQSNTDYPTYNMFFKKGRVTIDDGVGIQRTLMTRLSNQARFVSLYGTDNTAVVDLLEQMNITWKHATVSWAYEVREMLMNRGKSRINNIIKPRRADAMLSLIELIEKALWTNPAVGSKDPLGIPHWIVKNSSQGFNGGHPSGYSSIAGIDVSSVTNFKNYTNTFSAYTKADLVTKLRRAHRRIRFKSPITQAEVKGANDRYRLYTNETSYESIQDIGEAQNENLGRDIASMEGTIVFKKHPIVWIEELDDDTDNPIYLINHDTMYPVVLRGDFLRETGPIRSAKQHNNFETFVDLTLNNVCIDRRRNGVIYQV